jgi:hypothetical protein
MMPGVVEGGSEPTDTAWSQAIDDLSVAKQSFLDEANRYDTGSQDAAIERLERYLDPAEPRAEVIRAFANGVIAEIRKFRNARAFLTSQVAMSGLAAEVAHGVLAQRALSTAMSEITGMGTRRQSSEEAVEHVGAEFAVLSELGRVVVVELARALTVGAYVIELRRKTLEEYCDQSSMLDRKSVVTSLGSLIAEEGLADFVKEFGPQVIGMGVPVVHIAVGLAQVGANMREKIRTIEAHYQRGPLDAMFDLAQRVHDEQQAIDAALVFTEQARASIESVSRAQSATAPSVP